MIQSSPSALDISGIRTLQQLSKEFRGIQSGTRVRIIDGHEAFDDLVAFFQFLLIANRTGRKSIYKLRICFMGSDFFKDSRGHFLCLV